MVQVHQLPCLTNTKTQLKMAQKRLRKLNRPSPGKFSTKKIYQILKAKSPTELQLLLNLSIKLLKTPRVQLRKSKIIYQALSHKPSPPQNSAQARYSAPSIIKTTNLSHFQAKRIRKIPKGSKYLLTAKATNFMYHQIL